MPHAARHSSRSQLQGPSENGSPPPEVPPATSGSPGKSCRKAAPRPAPAAIQESSIRSQPSRPPAPAALHSPEPPNHIRTIPGSLPRTGAAHPPSALPLAPLKNSQPPSHGSEHPKPDQTAHPPRAPFCAAPPRHAPGLASPTIRRPPGHPDSADAFHGHARPHLQKAHPADPPTRVDPGRSPGRDPFQGNGCGNRFPPPERFETRHAFQTGRHGTGTRPDPPEEGRQSETSNSRGA